MLPGKGVVGWTTLSPSSGENAPTYTSASTLSPSTALFLLQGGLCERRQDHVRDILWLRDHDHVGALDLGDRSPGALGHRTDGIGAHHFVAGRDHRPGWQVLPGR